MINTKFMIMIMSGEGRGETAELGSTDRDLQLYLQYFFKTF